MCIYERNQIMNKHKASQTDKKQKHHILYKHNGRRRTKDEWGSHETLP